MQQDLRAVRLYTEHCQVERAMFCPDPNGPHTIKETVAKLIDMMKEVPPDSPERSNWLGRSTGSKTSQSAVVLCHRDQPLMTVVSRKPG